MSSSLANGLRVFSAAVLLFTLPRMPAAEERIDYVRHVKPILAENCYRCHGVKRQRSSLRLDSATAVLLGGDSGAAIRPGSSAESLLILAVTGSKGVEKMPPKGPGLSSREIEILRAWIDQGAKSAREEVAASERRTSAHWAFQPVVRPAPAATERRS